jgi:hypothetical protein
MKHAQDVIKVAVDCGQWRAVMESAHELASLAAALGENERESL